MDIRAASYPRLAPAAPAWRRDPRERSDHRRPAPVILAAVGTAEIPLGPAPSFMAQVLGQGVLREANPSGAAIYAAARRQRLACGVCADERA